eukprot:4417257-Amphidinium_carterae.1
MGEGEWVRGLQLQGDFLKFVGLRTEQQVWMAQTGLDHLPFVSGGARFVCGHRKYGNKDLEELASQSNRKVHTQSFWLLNETT